MRQLPGKRKLITDAVMASLSANSGGRFCRQVWLWSDGGRGLIYVHVHARRRHPRGQSAIKVHDYRPRAICLPGEAAGDGD